MLTHVVQLQNLFINNLSLIYNITIILFSRFHAITATSGSPKHPQATHSHALRAPVKKPAPLPDETEGDQAIVGPGAAKSAAGIADDGVRGGSVLAMEQSPFQHADGVPPFTAEGAVCGRHFGCGRQAAEVP